MIERRELVTQGLYQADGYRNCFDRHWDSYITCHILYLQVHNVYNVLHILYTVCINQ